MILTSDITVEEVRFVGNEVAIVTAGLPYLLESGEDDVMAAAARVSTKGWDSVPEAECFGLINYLMKHRHGTPFEVGQLTVRVHAPIVVWREWHRHRMMSYNEESGRYKQLEPVFYIPPRDRPMIKVDGWKPGRPKFMTLDEYCDGDEYSADEIYGEIINDMEEGYRQEYARYQRQLDRKLDPGLARDNLPVGIYSSCWVTANPRSIMAFLSLRTHWPDAAAVSYPLYEIEVAARKLEEIFASHWPLTHKAFCQNGRTDP